MSNLEQEPGGLHKLDQLFHETGTIPYHGWEKVVPFSELFYAIGVREMGEVVEVQPQGEPKSNPDSQTG